MPHLFSEFKPVNASQWKEQAIKDLKGIAFESLFSVNNSGIKIKPFYTAEDISVKQDTLFAPADWELTVKINETSDEAANKQILKALNSGASSLLLNITTDTQLDVLLKDVSVEHIMVSFYLNLSTEAFHTKWEHYLKNGGVDKALLRGAFILDPLSNLAENGNWKNSETLDLSELAALQKNNITHHTLCINAAIYHNAGADVVFETACVLAHAHELLVKCTEQGINHTAQQKPLWVSLAVGADFFGEIARLRALRLLWKLVAKEYGTNENLFIQCETSQINKSALDPYTNMLRTTTESMSAVIGGAEALLVYPFNSCYSSSDDFSGRMAINQQLILKEEAYLNKVGDKGAGSYYIESLTQDIAEAVWKQFQLIEEMGGFLNALKSGYIQQEIERAAVIQQGLVNEGKRILLGVNKYPNAKENTGHLNEMSKKEKAVGQTHVKPLKPFRYAEKMEQERVQAVKAG